MQYYIRVYIYTHTPYQSLQVVMTKAQTRQTQPADHVASSKPTHDLYIHDNVLTTTSIYNIVQVLIILTSSKVSNRPASALLVRLVPLRSNMRLILRCITHIKTAYNTLRYTTNKIIHLNIPLRTRTYIYINKYKQESLSSQTLSPQRPPYRQAQAMIIAVLIANITWQSHIIHIHIHIHQYLCREKIF